MIVDRRKDSYDELQILAGDVRTRRRRANIVTTLLIVGGIVGTAAYIATMNQQVEALAGERDNAVTERDALELALRTVDEENAEFRAQLYAELADHIVNITNREPGDPIGLIDFPNEIELTTQSITDSQERYTNLVYIVDGSRRFPMAVGDVLWIPEAQFWIRLEGGRYDADDKLIGGLITKHEGASSPDSAAAGQNIPIGDIGAPTDVVIEARGNSQGVANCLSLGLGTVTRTGFGFNYFDMDVRVYSNPNCA